MRVREERTSSVQDSANKSDNNLFRYVIQPGEERPERSQNGRHLSFQGGKRITMKCLNLVTYPPDSSRDLHDPGRVTQVGASGCCYWL